MKIIKETDIARYVTYLEYLLFEQSHGNDIESITLPREDIPWVVSKWDGKYLMRLRDYNDKENENDIQDIEKKIISLTK